MLDVFRVNNVAFTFMDYPMSYLELVGTIFYLWSVWLIAKRQILTWPIGIVSVFLYMALFYQIRLYADAFEQVYYLGVSFYGWWRWNKPQQNTKNTLRIQYSSRLEIILWIGITIMFAIMAGALISRLHLWFPNLFPETASFPFLDALTTIMSFTAMWLMTQKRIESWIYWVIVDVIGIGLYFIKEIRFVALLYIILLILAIKGLVEWQRAASASSQYLDLA